VAVKERKNMTEKPDRIEALKDQLLDPELSDKQITQIESKLQILQALEK
jgi:hypothetical protein